MICANKLVFVLEFSERTLIDTANLGYKTVMWSFAYKDWEEKKQPQEQEAQKIITDRKSTRLNSSH